MVLSDEISRATRSRVCSKSVFPARMRQNCFGRSSPAIRLVSVFNLVPSPPARITAHSFLFRPFCLPLGACTIGDTSPLVDVQVFSPRALSLGELDVMFFLVLLILRPG